MRYCCFEVTDRAGVSNVVDHHTVDYTSSPVSGKHCVNMLDYPKVFKPQVEEDSDDREVKPKPVLDSDGEIELRGTFFAGWENLPTWTFDPDTRQFSPIDPHELIGIKRWYRRERLIDPRLRIRIGVDTEFKHLRKAVLAIADHVGAGDLEAVKALQSLSDYIEQEIARFPKEETDKRDPKEWNGVSKKRLEALHRTGYDLGPTGYDIDAEPDPRNRNKKDELKQRNALRKAQIQAEKEISRERRARRN